MELAKRDLNIRALQQELDYRRNMLLDKRNNLRQIQGENKYLIDIANDYERYYNAIKDERKKQHEAFELLSKYISNISSDTTITQHLVEQSRTQQKEITKEIDRLRVELDKMTE
jgi:hypothetical protein